MKYLFVLLLTLLVDPALAQVSKDDLLKRIDNGSVSFQRAPLMPLNQQIIDQLMARTKARYPNFKESMWYYHYILDNGYYSIVFYDWTANECQFFLFNKKALNEKSGEVASFIENPAKGNSMARRESIPVKYCETLYNFYAKERQ